MANRKLSIALIAALAAGLPAVASADVPSQQDIDLYSVLGDNTERSAGSSARAPEFAGASAERQGSRLRGKLDRGDPRDDRFQGPGYRTP